MSEQVYNDLYVINTIINQINTYREKYANPTAMQDEMDELLQRKAYLEGLLDECSTVE